MNVYQWVALLVSLARGAVSESTVDYAAAARMKFVDKFKYVLNPELGYQPYWVDGDAIIHDETAETYAGYVEIKKYTFVMTQPPTTKPPPQMVCGEECQEHYRSIKHVCAHDTNSNNMAGCWRHPLGPNSDNKHCWNVDPDVFVDPFHEFKTYCEFLEATCRQHFTAPRYILLHIGKCKTEQFWFKDLKSFTDVFNRLSSYPLLDFERRTTVDPLASIKTKRSTPK